MFYASGSHIHAHAVTHKRQEAARVSTRGGPTRGAVVSARCVLCAHPRGIICAGTRCGRQRQRSSPEQDAAAIATGLQQRRLVVQRRQRLRVLRRAHLCSKTSARVAGISVMMAEQACAAAAATRAETSRRMGRRERRALKGRRRPFDNNEMKTPLPAGSGGVPSGSSSSAREPSRSAAASALCFGSPPSEAPRASPPG